MENFSKVITKINTFSSEKEIEDIIFQVFNFQLENTSLYKAYCEQIEKTKPQSITEIPFLPIQFFKSHEILTRKQKAEKIFMSSGTTGSIRSKHYVADLSLYKTSFTLAFERAFGKLKDLVILALLPNYIEQGNSSLIYMVEKLIQYSKNELSGFCLDNTKALMNKIQLAKKGGKKIILFGVSYALLDLAEQEIDLSNVIIIETGGMKGRRKEMVKEELHAYLCTYLNVDFISSEYGMAELLSQAYSDKNGIFTTPPWMKILIRDTSDPFSYIENSKTGGINIIDLANVYSCSFIATQDLGKKIAEGFQLMGRFDNSEIRGCNLLVN